MRKRLQASPRREGYAGLRKQAKQASPRREGYAGLYVDKAVATGRETRPLLYVRAPVKGSLPEGAGTTKS